MTPFVTDPVGSEDAPSTWPRLLSRKMAARYYSVSEREIDRLIAVGALSKVKLPVTRDDARNVATRGETRRVLIDRLELDALCDRSRERIR